VRLLLLQRVRLVCRGKCTDRSTSGSTLLVRAPRGPFFVATGGFASAAAVAADPFNVVVVGNDDVDED